MPPPFRTGTSPGSFQKQPLVSLTGLQAKPEFNGKFVEIHSIEANGRWGVLPEGSGAKVSVSKDRLEIVTKPSIETPVLNVMLQGLESRPELNGQVGSCDAFQADRARYPVSLNGSQRPLLLRSSCLQDVDSKKTLVDPVLQRDCTMNGQPQQTLVAVKKFSQGDMILKDKAIISLPALEFSRGDEHLYQFLAAATQRFLNLQEAVKMSVLDLYSHESFHKTVADGRTKERNPKYKSHNDRYESVSKGDMINGLKGAGLKVQDCDVDDIWKFVRVWECNSFAVGKNHGLFSTLSRINHSCRPNCFRAELSDDEFALVALQDLDHSEELFISYLNESSRMQPADFRRNRLRSWAFDCACEWCIRSEEPMCSVLCIETDGCNGIRRRVGLKLEPCNVCGDMFSDDEVQALIAREKGFEEFYHCIEGNPAIVGYDQGKSLHQAMQQIQEMFPATHWLARGFHDLEADFQTQLGALEEARGHINDIIAFQNDHFVEPCVQRALSRKQLALVELRLGNAYAAFEQLKLCLNELYCILPFEHEFCDDARNGMLACFKGYAGMHPEAANLMRTF